MRVITVILVFILNFILQSTVFLHASVFEVRPNTAIVLIVCFAFIRTDIEGAIIGFFAGLLYDMIFCNFIGFNALAYATIGFLCGKPFKDYFRENFLFPVLLTAVSAFCYETILYFTHFMLFGKTDTSYYMTRTILPSSLYTTICAFPCYWLVLKLNAALEKHEKKRRV